MKQKDEYISIYLIECKMYKMIWFVIPLTPRAIRFIRVVSIIQNIVPSNKVL
jgi:hypothetical protein